MAVAVIMTRSMDEKDAEKLNGIALKGFWSDCGDMRDMFC
jgi:hypothetical protein